MTKTYLNPIFLLTYLCDSSFGSDSTDSSNFSYGSDSSDKKLFSINNKKSPKKSVSPKNFFFTIFLTKKNLYFFHKQACFLFCFFAKKTYFFGQKLVSQQKNIFIKKNFKKKVLSWRKKIFKKKIPPKKLWQSKPFHKKNLFFSKKKNH